MQLSPGQPLGPYQIVDKIGEGGMGAVYRARDTRLNRSVAVKVLSEELTAHPKSRERLAREARAISSLSHPNICALYDIGHLEGIDYLVMEFLEGETLAYRLARGPFPLRQALRYGAEIAGALAAAHRAGVIHRDLKPANVMLTRTGARLLDFGLAKQAEGESDSRALTARSPLTDAGTVVGTLFYMSPEQAAGQSLDARSDIFSFGAVLYEMLTGRRAFDGQTRTSVINAILNDQPPALRDVPEPVERLVRKCLEKSPDDRWQSAHDVADELQWIGSGSSGATPIAAPAGAPRWILAAALAALIVAVIVIAVLRLRPSTATRSAARFAINPPPGMSFAQRATNHELALSPDGKLIAYVALQGGRRSLFVRPMNELTPREIAGTEGALSPFWSPDSKWIGFFAKGFMKKVLQSGGPAQVLCRANGGSASWGKEGSIIFGFWGTGPGSSEAIGMISENGGTTRFVTDRNGWHFWPVFLSDGHHFIYRLNRGPRPETGLYLASLDDAKTTFLLPGTSRAEADRDNMLYFVRDGVLVKQQLDLEHRKMTGEAMAIAQPVFEFFPTANANFSVDAAGDVVAYQRAPAETQLVWRDRDGHETGRLRPMLTCRNFRISPDGRRVAIEQFEPSSEVPNVWMYDLGRDVMTRLTSNRYATATPIWTADGRELVVSNCATGQEIMPPQLARMSLASGVLRQLIENDGVEFPTDISRDGRAALYTIDRGDQRDIEMLSMSGDRKSAPIASSEFNESYAVLSPDGRWMAFQSDESGRPEVYVRPFGREGETTRVSTDGGSEPRWNPRGRDLYYVAPGGDLMDVTVTLSRDSIALGRPVLLFRISSVGMMEFEELGSTHYDVAPDGQHFLVREIPRGSDDAPVVVIALR